MPPLAAAAPAIAAIGTAASAGVGIAGALKGPGGGAEAGFSISPELELQMLDTFQNNIKQAQEDYQSYGMAADTYIKNIDLFQQQVQGLMPSEEVQKQLTQNAADLVLGLGKDAKSLVENGFLTQGDIDQLSSLKGINEGKYTNQVTEDQIASQKRQLEQELARSGVPPSQRAIALQQFEESARSQRETSYNNQASRIMQTLEGGAALRQQGYNQTYNTLGATNTAIGQIWQGKQAILGADQMKYGVAGDKYQAGIAKRANDIGQYQEIGKFILSDKTKSSLASGQYVPGQFVNPNTGETGGTTGGGYQTYDQRLASGGNMPENANFSKWNDEQRGIYAKQRAYYTSMGKDKLLAAGIPQGNYIAMEARKDALKGFGG